MKKILLTLMAACDAFSLDKEKETGFGFGVKAGVNISNQTLDDAAKYKAGFTGGVFVDYRTCNWFAVSADVLYSRQGSKIKDSDVKLRTDYLNIPVLANFYLTRGMALTPGLQVGRASVKRVNILSDLIRQEEHPRLEEADLYFDTTFLAEGRAIEAAAAADSLAADSAGGRQAAEPEIRELVWDLPGYRPMPGHDRSGNEGTGIDSAALVAIEDFGGEVPAMEHFYRTMLEKDRRRPVRIAVLGDSFIEGDIVPADVRARLQDLYGGCGVGFVPFSSPIALYRATVRHTNEGWKTYDDKANRKVHENVRDK